MKIRYLLLFFCFLVGCGVKGKPLPPLEPARIGQGEPQFSQATKDIQVKKKKTKKIEGDWEEQDDFSENGKE